MVRSSLTLGLLCLCLVLGCCTAKSVLKPVAEKRESEARMEGSGLQLEEYLLAADDKLQLVQLGASLDFPSDRRGMSSQTSPGLRKKRALHYGHLQDIYNTAKAIQDQKKKEAEEKLRTPQAPSH